MSNENKDESSSIIKSSETAKSNEEIKIENFNANEISNLDNDAPVNDSVIPSPKSTSIVFTSSSNESVNSFFSWSTDVPRESLESYLYSNKTPPSMKNTSHCNLLYQEKPIHSRLILCVGLCTLDILHLCEESQTETQYVTKGYWQRSGNASNNCTVLSNLGANCEFLGIMSKAPAFKFLLEDNYNRGILIGNCPLVDMYPPFSSILFCPPTGAFDVIHTNLGFPILKFEHFKRNIHLENYEWIHFEARNPQETKLMLNMIRRYNTDHNTEMGKPIQISLEIAKRDKTLLCLAIRVHLIFVGRDFALYMGWSSPKDTVYNFRQLISIKQLREEKDIDEMDICFSCPHIVCPWGSEGCSLLSSSYEYDHIPAVEIDSIVDSKGSGDVFVATIIYAMNNLSMNLKDAVNLGCKVAIYKVQHWGLDCIKDYEINETRTRE